MLSEITLAKNQSITIEGLRRKYQCKHALYWKEPICHAGIKSWNKFSKIASIFPPLLLSGGCRWLHHITALHTRQGTARLFRCLCGAFSPNLEPLMELTATRCAEVDVFPKSNWVLRGLIRNFAESTNYPALILCSVLPARSGPAHIQQPQQVQTPSPFYSPVRTFLISKH